MNKQHLPTCGPSVSTGSPATQTGQTRVGAWTASIDSSLLRGPVGCSPCCPHIECGGTCSPANGHQHKPPFVCMYKDTGVDTLRIQIREWTHYVYRYESGHIMYKGDSCTCTVYLSITCYIKKGVRIKYMHRKTRV